jgi:hypothetical protein
MEKQGRVDTRLGGWVTFGCCIVLFGGWYMAKFLFGSITKIAMGSIVDW